jgi:glycosyltransferase involved in cell wall biosynthesis
MKILLTSSSGIYDSSFPETKKNHTGLCIMIRALADMLAYEGDEVDIITNSVFTKGRKINKATLLKKTWGSVIFHTKPFYIRKAFPFLMQKGLPFKTRLKEFLAFMTTSYTEHLIKKNKYDVVHINGIGSRSIGYMYACVRTATPFVLTLHGLNSFTDKIRSTPFSKKMERNFFLHSKDNEKTLSTVISTGIKRRLCEAIGKDLDTINVVCNPVINSSEAGVVPYEKADGEKIIVTVGNISKNKNQRLVIDAFAKMKSEHEGKYKLFVIGGNEGTLESYVKENNITDVTFTGALDKSMVNEYYKIADLCVMASVNEGFGLSLVEGYSYGVPSVMPESIDAYPDLYEEYACVGAGSYDVSVFADALYTALSREWDKEKIKEKAKDFTEEICAHKYLSVLRRAAEFKSSPFDIKVLDEIVKKSKCK